MYLEDGCPIIRLYENSGKTTKTRICFFKKVQEAEVLDLRNNVTKRLPVEHETIDIALNPYEIVTLRLRLA